MPQTDFSPYTSITTACMLGQALKHLDYKEAMAALNVLPRPLPELISDFSELLSAVMVASGEANAALLECLQPALAELVNDFDKLLSVLRFLEPKAAMVLFDVFKISQSWYALITTPSQVLALFIAAPSKLRKILLSYLGDCLVNHIRNPKTLSSLLCCLRAEAVYDLYGLYEAENPVFARANGDIFLTRLIACCDNATGTHTIMQTRAVLARFVSQKLSLQSLQYALCLTELSTIFDALGSPGLYALCPNLSDVMRIIQTTDNERIRLCILQKAKSQLCKQTQTLDDMTQVLGEASSEFSSLYLEALGWGIVNELIPDHAARMQFLQGASLSATAVVAKRRPSLLTRGISNIGQLGEVISYLDAASAEWVLLKDRGLNIHRLYESNEELIATLALLGDAKQLIVLTSIMDKLPDACKKCEDWLALLNILENQSCYVVIARFQDRIIDTVKTEGDKNALLARFVKHEEAYLQLQKQTCSKARFFKPQIVQEERGRNGLRCSA